jgi:UDP-N-acetylmuramoyl-tripeptide--D-alanyl-D-alanine ligase
MSSLWSLDAMSTAMRAEPVGALPAELSGISIDSRTLAKGDAFFAVQGENRDGHDFVDNALKAGAGLAVVARSQQARFGKVPLLVIADVISRVPHERARARKSSR